MKNIPYTLTCTILVTLACGTSNLAPTIAPTFDPNALKTATVGTSLAAQSQTQIVSVPSHTSPNNIPQPTETNLPTETQSPRDQENFTVVGYLKDNANNRIFTISYKPGTSEVEIRDHAEGLMFTQGQMMAAYFYADESNIPADGVTLAGSVFEANDVLYETPGLSKWRYAYMRYLNGTSEFVDCEQDPDNDLCRKE